MDLHKEYSNKVAEINLSKNRAFCGGSYTTNICGIPVRPLTFGAWIDLTCIGNGLFEDSWDLESVCEYIFRSHKKYPISYIHRDLLKLRILAIYKCTPSSLITGIRDHYNDAFRSLTTGRVRSKDGKNVDHIISSKYNPVSPFASMVDELCSRYSWDIDQLRDKPLNQLFQLITASRVNTIPNYVVDGNAELDSIKERLFNSLNQRNG